MKDDSMDTTYYENIYINIIIISLRTIERITMLISKKNNVTIYWVFVIITNTIILSIGYSIVISLKKIYWLWAYT